MRSMLSCTENLKAGGWLEFWDTEVGGTGPGAWVGCKDKTYGCTQGNIDLCKHIVQLQCLA